MQSMHESVASVMDAEPRSDCLMPCPPPVSHSSSLRRRAGWGG